MKRKVLMIMMMTIFGYQISQSQSQTETYYKHCDCNEVIHYSENDSLVKNGEYLFTCQNSLTEKGRYKYGKKDGLWTVHNKEGNLVSEIEYSDGKLNGKYDLYFYDGEVKLKAQFVNNKQTGEWKYLNKRGKVIKQGKYEYGKPVGTWKVFNKRGKKVIAEYDFDKNQGIITSNPKIKKSILPRDDESGGYVIIYFPNRKNLTNNTPIEGSIVSNNFFINLLNIPFVLMDTKTQFEYKVTGKIIEGSLVVDKIEHTNDIKYNSGRVSFPYIAVTESKKNVSEIRHPDILIEKMKNRIYETLMVLGPWKSDSNDNFEIHTPIVLNDIDR